MFFNRNSYSTRFYRTAGRNLSVLTAVLVACALFAHTFDTCASHFGAFATAPIFVTQSSEFCSHNSAANCEICTSQQNDCSDSCDKLSETAVRNSSTQLHVDAGITHINFAILPVVSAKAAFTSSLNPRAGPSFVAPVSICLRSSLPARAPPYSI